MIRKIEANDISKVMKIWLATNIRSHDFIDKSYWNESYELVKEMLPKAEIYICEENNDVKGFVGLSGDYIEGIFVKENAQAKGFGNELINYVKQLRDELELKVYQKNERAVEFYKKADFCIVNEDIDINTDEKEYKMAWKKQFKI